MNVEIQGKIGEELNRHELPSFLRIHLDCYQKLNKFRLSQTAVKDMFEFVSRSIGKKLFNKLELQLCINQILPKATDCSSEKDVDYLWMLLSKRKTQNIGVDNFITFFKKRTTDYSTVFRNTFYGNEQILDYLNKLMHQVRRNVQEISYFIRRSQITMANLTNLFKNIPKSNSYFLAIRELDQYICSRSAHCREYFGQDWITCKDFILIFGFGLDSSHRVDQKWEIKQVGEKINNGQVQQNTESEGIFLEGLLAGIDNKIELFQNTKTYASIYKPQFDEIRHQKQITIKKSYLKLNTCGRERDDRMKPSLNFSKTESSLKERKSACCQTLQNDPNNENFSKYRSCVASPGHQFYKTGKFTDFEKELHQKKIQNLKLLSNNKIQEIESKATMKVFSKKSKAFFNNGGKKKKKL